MKNIFFLFLITLISACKIDHNTQEKSKTIEQKNYVKLASVETKTEPIPIQAIGRLGSDTEVKLSFKIGGIISSIKIKIPIKGNLKPHRDKLNRYKLLF